MADDALEILLTLDADRFLVQVNRVNRATRSMQSGINSVTNSTRTAKSGLSSLTSSLNDVYDRFGQVTGVASGLVGSLLAVGGAFVAASFGAVKKAGEFEQLELSLKAIEGSAKGARKSLLELEDIARGPGLGRREAVQTYSGIRRGGLPSDFALSFTEELGNAVSYSGGNNDTLGRLGAVINKIVNQRGIQGDELMQLNEAGIPASKMLMDAFGTVDAGELKKLGKDHVDVLKVIYQGLVALPRVEPGITNNLENLSDSLEKSIESVGRGISKGLVPNVGTLEQALSELHKMNYFEGLGEQIGKMYSTLSETFGTGSLQNDLKAVGNLANLAAMGISELAGPLKNLSNGLLGVADMLSFGLVNAIKNKMVQALGFSNSHPDEANLNIEGRGMIGATAKNSIVQETPGRQGRLQKASDSIETYQRDSETLSETKVFAQRQVSLLDRIEDNTSELKGFKDAILGGGSRTQATFNAHNIGAWSGGDSKITQGMQMIMEGFSQKQAAMLTGIARQRTLNPGSI